ncbi:unnamed protein product [Mortierella alpina]
MRISILAIVAVSASATLADNWLARCTMTLRDRHSDKGLISKFVMSRAGTTQELYYPELRSGASKMILVYTLDHSDPDNPFGCRVHIKQQFFQGDRYFWGLDDNYDDREIMFKSSAPADFKLVGDSDRFMITRADGRLGVQPGGPHNGLMLGDLRHATQFRLLDELSCSSRRHQA